MMATLRCWHRRLGLTAAILLALLGASGMLLNHADALGLARQHLHTPWLLHLYGTPAAAPRSAWRVQKHWLSDWDGQLALDDVPLALQAPQGLVGVLSLNGNWLLAEPQRATLLTPQGDSVDTLTYPAGQRANAAALAADGTVWLRTDSGTWLRADSGLTAFEPGTPPTGLTAAASSALPAALAQRLSGQGMGPGISLERLLLDLHGGRFLGAAGPWVMDAAALCLLALAGSGLWMSISRKRP